MVEDKIRCGALSTAEMLMAAFCMAARKTRAYGQHRWREVALVGAIDALGGGGVVDMANRDKVERWR